MDIDKELIYLDKKFESQEELFDFMADVLFEKGYVLDEYREKIKERERNFPTGFKLKIANVAMPHTDPEYTTASKIIVIKVPDKVEFSNAENNEKIMVEIVFGLIFQDRERHIDDLMKLVNLFQDEETLSLIKNSENKDEIYEVLQKTFK